MGEVEYFQKISKCYFASSVKHVRGMYTPLEPHFYIAKHEQNWGMQGSIYFSR